MARPPEEQDSDVERRRLLEHITELWESREFLSKAEAMGAPRGSRLDPEHGQMIERSITASLYLECSRSVLIPVVLTEPVWTVNSWDQSAEPHPIDPRTFEFPDHPMVVSCTVTAEVIPALVR